MRIYHLEYGDGTLRTLLCRPADGRLRESDGEWKDPSTAERVRSEEWRDAGPETLSEFKNEHEKGLTQRISASQA